MATKNIVPRADNEGGLGRSSRYWNSIYVNEVYLKSSSITFITNYAGNSLSQAVTDIGSDEVSLIIDRRISIEDDLVIPDNITLVFARGGSLFRDNTNVNVTLSNIIAGEYTIFEGYDDDLDDFITFDKPTTMHVDWWGADPYGSSNSADAINSCFKCAKETDYNFAATDTADPARYENESVIHFKEGGLYLIRSNLWAGTPYTYTINKYQVSVIYGNGSQILGEFGAEHDEEPMLDLAGAGNIKIFNLKLFGDDSGSHPAGGIFCSRINYDKSDDDAGTAPAAGNHVFSNVEVRGKFKYYFIYSYGSEGNVYDRCYLYSTGTPGNMIGMFVTDSENYWSQCTSPNTQISGYNSAETTRKRQSNTVFTFRSCWINKSGDDLDAAPSGYALVHLHDAPEARFFANTRFNSSTDDHPVIWISSAEEGHDGKSISIESCLFHGNHEIGIYISKVDQYHAQPQVKYLYVANNKATITDDGYFIKSKDGANIENLHCFNNHGDGDLDILFDENTDVEFSFIKHDQGVVTFDRIFTGELITNKTRVIGSNETDLTPVFNDPDSVRASLTYIDIQEKYEYGEQTRISKVLLDNDLSYCGTGTYKTIDGSQSNVGFGDVLYVDTDGELALADASNYSTARALYMVADSGTGEKEVILPGAYVRNDAWSFTAGDRIWLSKTAGNITATQPSTTGDQIQYIGHAESATMIYFNPSQNILEVA